MQVNLVEIKQMFSVLVVLGSLFLVLFLYNWRNLELSSMHYEMHTLKQKKKQLYLSIEKQKVWLSKRRPLADKVLSRTMSSDQPSTQVRTVLMHFDNVNFVPAK